MELIKAFLLIFLSVIACGCFIGDDLSQESKLCYKLINKSGKRIGEKFGIEPSAVGAGGVDGLKLMTIYFDKYGDLLTQEEARKLIILCTEEFLKDINSDEKLRPYLMDFPFSERNINISIFSYDYKGRDIYEEILSNVVYERSSIYLICNR